MLPKYDSRRSHWLFFGKICSGLGSRAQRTLERIRPTKGASRMAPFFLCARHGVDAGGDSPLRARVRGTASRRQLRRREAGWGGSRRRSSDVTNRNRIEGRRGVATRQLTGTPDAHPDTRAGKSGRGRRSASHGSRQSRVAGHRRSSRWRGRAVQTAKPLLWGGMAAPAGQRRVIAPQQARSRHVKMSSPILLPAGRGVLLPWILHRAASPRCGTSLTIYSSKSGSLSSDPAARQPPALATCRQSHR